MKKIMYVQFKYGPNEMPESKEYGPFLGVRILLNELVVWTDINKKFVIATQDKSTGYWCTEGSDRWEDVHFWNEEDE